MLHTLIRFYCILVYFSKGLLKSNWNIQYNCNVKSKYKNMYFKCKYNIAQCYNNNNVSINLKTKRDWL